jgi:hypothetical protein
MNGGITVDCLRKMEARIIVWYENKILEQRKLENA